MNRAHYAPSPLLRSYAQAQFETMPKKKSSRGHGAAAHTERKPFATSEAQNLAKDLNHSWKRIEELRRELNAADRKIESLADDLQDKDRRIEELEAENERLVQAHAAIINEENDAPNWATSQWALKDTNNMAALAAEDGSNE